MPDPDPTSARAPATATPQTQPVSPIRTPGPSAPGLPRPLAQDRLPHRRRAPARPAHGLRRRRGRRAGRPPRLPGPRHRRQRRPGRLRGRGAPPRRALPHHRQRPHRLPPPASSSEGTLRTPPSLRLEYTQQRSVFLRAQGQGMYAQHTASLYDGRQGRNTYPSAPFSAVQGAPGPRRHHAPGAAPGPLPPGAQVYLLCDDYGPQITYAARNTRFEHYLLKQHGAVERARRRPRLAGRPPAGRLRRGRPPPLPLGAPPGLRPGAPHHRGRQPDRGHRGGQHLQGRPARRRPRRLGVGRPLPGQHQHPPLRGALPPGGGQRVPLRRRAPRRRGWQRLPPRAVHERRLPGGVLHQRRRAPRPDLQLDLLGQRLPLQPPPGDAQHRDPRRVQRGEPLPAQRRPRGADGGGGRGHHRTRPRRPLQHPARELRPRPARPQGPRPGQPPPRQLARRAHRQPGHGDGPRGQPAGAGGVERLPLRPLLPATTTPRRRESARPGGAHLDPRSRSG